MASENNNPFADLPDAQNNPFADLPEVKQGESGLLPALGAGIDQVQEMGYRAVKGFTDVGENPNDYKAGTVGRSIAGAIGQGGALSKWAGEGIRRNQEEQKAYSPTVDSYKDIDSIGDAASYVGEMTAQSVPMMVASMNPVSAATMAGGLSNEAYEKQEDKQPWRAVTSGVGQMALERLGTEAAVGRIMGDSGVLRNIRNSALGEGATEVGGEVLSQWGGGASLDELENLDEAFVGGAAVGGTIRGGVETGKYGLDKYRGEDRQKPVQQELNNDEELDLTRDPDLDPFADAPPQSDADQGNESITVIRGKEQAQDWKPNWEFGQNDMPYRGQMAPYTYQGEYEQYRETPNSVPVGNVLESPIIEGEYRRPRGLPDRSDVIYGEDGRPIQRAQEQAENIAQRSDRLLPEKDVIFAEDGRNVRLKNNGEPFGGRRAAELTPEYRQAIQEGLSPQVIRVNGGYGWVANNSAESDPFMDLPTAKVAAENEATGTVNVNTSPRRQTSSNTNKTKTTAYTPGGRGVDVEYGIIDADQLVTSNLDDGRVNPDYPQTLQPRDRTRAVSELQINNIANNLNPALLGESATTSDGAPIIAEDGTVESGNGRSLALKRAYQRNQADDYRQSLIDQGYNVDGVEKPVLVRVRRTPMNDQERVNYTRESNERSTLSMSASEKAKSDGDAIKRVIGDYQGGDITAAANRGFVRKFMQGAISPSEQADMVDGKGQLSQNGRRRVEAAMISAAYDDAGLVNDLFESADSEIKSIGGAMLDASGSWAKMREASQAGATQSDIDITPNVVEAVNLVRRSRSEGKKLSEMASQSDMFSGDIDPTTKMVLGIFYGGDNFSKPRSRQHVREALDRYAELAGNTQGGDSLFGDELESVSPNQLLGQANETGKQTEQISERPAEGEKEPSQPVTNTGASGPGTGRQRKRPDATKNGGTSPERPAPEALESQPPKNSSRTIKKSGIGIDVPAISKEIEDSYNRTTHVGRGRDFNMELISSANDILSDLDERGLLDTPERKAKAKAEIETYLDKQASFIRREAIRSQNNPSWIVTGRSNRDMERSNKRSEKSREAWKKEVDSLDSLRKRIANRVGDVMNEAQLKEKYDRETQQSRRQSRNEFARLAGTIAADLKGGRLELAKEGRKWANKKMENLLDGMSQDDAKSLITEVDKGLDSEGGIVEVVGKRSNLAKRIRAIQDDLNKTAVAEIDRAANEAATSPQNTNKLPTEAQKDAGNYKKGKIKLHGLDISIENPKGSIRSGTDADGKQWQTKMQNHYGDIKTTTGADGDPIDVFVGDKPDSQKVFIVDQVDPKTGEFDEVKTMLGFESKVEAEKAYLANYDKGWKGMGNISETSVADFKGWLKKPRKSKQPFAKQVTKETNTPANQEDWGEKISTSRKNIAQRWSESSSNEEISRQPLSKTWPDKEFDDLGNPFASAFAYAARSEIPRKPNQPHKRDRWVEKVKSFRQLVKDNVVDGLLTGKLTEEKIRKASDNHNLRDFLAKVDVLQHIDRKNWSKIDRVITYPDAKKYNPATEKMDLSSPTTYVKISGRNREFNTTDPKEIAEQIKPYIDSLVNSKPEMQFEVRGSKGQYFINKKGDPEYAPLATFSSSKEALDFKRDNNSKLVEAWEARKAKFNVKKSDIRNKVNRPRTGQDYREGKDATAEDFQNKFGIKRGTFGKWVKQGNERQSMLNGAYDAMMDLSNITGLPPKALSLEGKLGFAFGANGRGNAMAHYEPGEIVINLTKTKGAGSLAHEWFHALDNYFQKKREASPNTEKGHYITHNPETYYIGPRGYALSESRFNNIKGINKDEWRKVESVRLEVAESFKNLVDTLNGLDFAKRSSRLDKGKAGGYWSSNLEMAARAFESYVIAKMNANGYNNDFLANVTSEDSFIRDNSRYPYIKADEMLEVESAFDDLFNTIQTKEDADGEVSLFNRTGNPDTPTNNSRPVISATDANKVISDFRAGLSGSAGDNFVVASSYDQLPDTIKKHAKAQGAEYQVKGVFHKGKVYVVLDQHTNPLDLEATLFHEAYGHQGIRNLFGNEITKKLNQLYTAIGGKKGLQETAARNGVDLGSYIDGLEGAALPQNIKQQMLMDELLAHLQQDNRPSVKRIVREILGMVRQGLKKLGLIKLSAISDSDLFYILRQARLAARKGSVNTGEPMFMREQKQFNLTESEAKAQGYDVDNILYHGSSSEDINQIERGISLPDGSDNIFSGIFASDEETAAAHGSGYIHRFVLKTPIAENSDIDTEKTKEFLERELGDALDTLTDDEFGQFYDSVVHEDDAFVWDSDNELTQKLMNEFLVDDPGQLSWNIQKHRGQAARFNGFDAVEISDEHGTSYLLVGDGVRRLISKKENEPDLENPPTFRRTDETERPSFKVPDETVIQKLIIRRLQDKFSRVKQAQKAIRESGKTISESADVYGAEALYYGKVEEDFRQLDEKYIEPLAKKMADANITQNELDLYLYALHAPERNKHIYENVDESTQSGSGMSDQEAKAIIDSVNRDPRRQQFNDLARDVRKMIDERTNEMKRQGLIDEETFDSYQNAYRFYVPLKGQASDEGGKPKGTGAGFNINGKESIKAMGRKSRAESPLIHAYMDTQKAIVRGHKNQVGNAMLNLIEETPNPEYWNVYTTQGPMKVAQDSDGKKITRPMNHIEMMAAARNPNEPWFATKKDGKQYFMQFADPILAQQLNNLGVDNGNGVTRTLGSINRYLAMMSTSANPEFLFTNASRDIQTALFNLAAESDVNDGRIKGLDIKSFSKKVMKDLPKSFNGIRKALRDNDVSSEWSQHFDKFRKNGAKTGYFDMKDLDQQASALDAMMQLQSKKGLLQYGKKALKFIDDYNSSVENAIRLSVYKNAIDEGVTEHQAALLAKDLTVNFNRKGEAGTWLNSLYLFANAGIQGTANFARAIGTFKVNDSGKKKLNLAQKAGIVMAGIGYGMAALNRLIAGDDDDGESYWDKVPDYIKERNFVLMMPGSNDYITIPMPYGYNIFANIGTAMEDVTLGNGDVAENTGWLAKAFMGSFLPLGLSEGSDGLATAGKTFAPQIGKPMIDLIDNSNFFGANIYNENNERFDTKKSDAATSFKSTNDFYKNAAMGLNKATGGSEYRSGVIDVHPETIRYLVDYVAGGAGRFAANVAESASKGAKGEFDADRTPFVRRFYGKTNDYGDQETFYNRLDEVETLNKELASLRGPEKLEFKKEHKTKLRLVGQAQSTKKRLSELRKRKERFENNGNEEAVKEVDEQMEITIDRFNLRYNNATQ